MTTLSVPVRAFLSGKVRAFARGENSAIAKAEREGAVQIGLLGLDGDEQADPRFHGGPDKALHHYPFDHYARWRESAQDHPLLGGAGAFGENVSTLGLTEEAVFIGDRFRLGTALVEISQGRQPCWKQGVRMEWTTLPNLMVRERRSGWYYRVIEQGVANKGDALTLVERPLPDWSVSRVFGILIAGDHKADKAALPELAKMELLFSGWRERAAELMQQ